jgi:uncharacterized membrane protein YgdD (TMEM256/DUF423 family)
MQKFILIAGGLLAALAVGFGAFGAHALENFLRETNRLETYETAVKYQFYHALGLLILGLLMFRINDVSLHYAGVSLMLGILLFSGSLYLICFTGYTRLGMITPLGGLLFILGWLFLVVGIYRGL